MYRVAVAAILVFGLVPMSNALDQTGQHKTAPKIDETQNADKKAEYLESIPYRPCPSSVVFPNGRHACIGGPSFPSADSVDGSEDHNDRNEMR
jgi:hypothetical protein